MIQLQDLTVRAGGFRIEGVHLEIRAGEYAVLMGRTGSGKTTILEAICGLRRVTSGSIRLMGRDVTRWKPAERGIGYVPQDRALFQTMTVRRNLAFALDIRGWPRREMAERVEELASWLGLSKLLDRLPAGLSGGEAQRVALGRALASRPAILCLDEPLSALDEETRDEIHGLLETIQDRTGATTLHVTHSRLDARRLADRVFRIRDGKVTEIRLEDIGA